MTDACARCAIPASKIRKNYGPSAANATAAGVLRAFPSRAFVMEVPKRKVASRACARPAVTERRAHGFFATRAQDSGAMHACRIHTSASGAPRRKAAAR